MEDPLFLKQPKQGITEEYGRMQNGIFFCSFNRDNYLEGQKDVFDLNKNWFMMFAEGPAVNGKNMTGPCREKTGLPGVQHS